MPIFGPFASSTNAIEFALRILLNCHPMKATVPKFCENIFFGIPLPGEETWYNHNNFTSSTNNCVENVHIESPYAFSHTLYVYCRFCAVFLHFCWCLQPSTDDNSVCTRVVDIPPAFTHLSGACPFSCQIWKRVLIAKNYCLFATYCGASNCVIVFLAWPIRKQKYQWSVSNPRWTYSSSLVTVWPPKF